MIFDYTEAFSSALQTIRKEKRYRTFVPLAKQQKSFPCVATSAEKTVTLWSTNDYLGLGQSKKAIQAMGVQAEKGGVSAGGTRNISGTHPLHVELEEALAKLHKKARALLFNSGYAANEWSLFTLGKLLPNCIFFSDAENHASLIAGIRAARCEKRVFRHHDLCHLKAMLKEAPADIPKVIVCESVYSMSGDIAPLADIVDLAYTHGALIFLDEVHAVGLYGEKGAGLAQKQGVDEHIALIQGTLGKAFGSLGGYVVGESTLIDVLRSTAWGFIFSTALPPPVVAASLANVREASENENLRSRFWQNVQKVRQELEKQQAPLLKTPWNQNSHILPLMINDSARCTALSQELLQLHGLYIQSLNYPTVPKGAERLRITPLAVHTDAMIQDMAQSLGRVIGGKGQQAV